MVSEQVRRARFAAFVDRALREAMARGLSVPQIALATGVGTATFYRWRKGEWTSDPRAIQVKRFCAGLGLDLDEAHRALDWHGPETPAEPQPLQNPLLVELARRLADPAVSREEKGMIEETIRMWIARGGSKARRR